jgi:membrane protein DedA with SNARE-associated domain
MTSNDFNMYLIYLLSLSVVILSGPGEVQGATTGEGEGEDARGTLDIILDAITSWIVTYGYPAIFAAALLENLFPPIPSEVIFPLVGFVAFSKNLGIDDAFGMAITGALGSTVGGIIIYFVSRWIGRSALLRLGRYIRIDESTFQRAESWFEKHGSIAVFAGRMAPGIRELISIPAGLSKMNLPKFVIFTFAGSSIWSLALTFVGYSLGDAWNRFSDQLSPILNIVAVLIVAGIIVLFVVRYYYRRKKKATYD